MKVERETQRSIDEQDRLARQYSSAVEFYKKRKLKRCFNAIHVFNNIRQKQKSQEEEVESRKQKVINAIERRNNSVGGKLQSITNEMEKLADRRDCKNADTHEIRSSKPYFSTRTSLRTPKSYSINSCDNLFRRDQKRKHEERELMNTRREAFLQRRREQKRIDEEAKENRERLLLEEDKEKQLQIKQQAELVKVKANEKRCQQNKLAKLHYRLRLLRRVFIGSLQQLVTENRFNENKASIAW